MFDNREDNNVDLAMPGLYISSNQAASKYDNLASKGITHVVNIFDHHKPHKEKGVEYLNVDILDLPDRNIAEHFELAHAFINAALHGQGTSKAAGVEGEDKKEVHFCAVLVHCWAGVSRSASVVLSYMMRYGT
jgi:atypical dual specificity phosphatase